MYKDGIIIDNKTFFTLIGNCQEEKMRLIIDLIFYFLIGLFFIGNGINVYLKIKLIRDKTITKKERDERSFDYFIYFMAFMFLLALAFLGLYGVIRYTM